MTHCRIGKITDKRTGNVIQRFPDKNLTVHTTDVNYAALKTANQYVKDGMAKAVGVVVILEDNTVFHDFEKRDTVSSVQVLGASSLFHQYVTDWIKG